jgi:cytochrome bd-I ubiquinol oxidase subunit X
MWYFSWGLGIGFAVLLAILNALWEENEEARDGAAASKADLGAGSARPSSES